MNSFIGAKMNDRLHRHQKVVGLGGDSQNIGNSLRERSCVRQSKYFRQYESGNGMKSLLGNSSLGWSTTEKEGVFKGQAIYDFDCQMNSRQPVPPRSMKPSHESKAWDEILLPENSGRLQVYPVAKTLEQDAVMMQRSTLGGMKSDALAVIDSTDKNNFANHHRSPSDVEIYSKYSRFAKVDSNPQLGRGRGQGSDMKDILRGNNFHSSLTYQKHK